jgi:hypothetical protein
MSLQISPRVAQTSTLLQLFGLPLRSAKGRFCFAAPRFSECGPRRVHAQEKRVRSLAAQNLWLHPRKISSSEIIMDNHGASQRCK